MAEQAIRVARGSADWIFFPLMALTIIVFVVIGFAPTYYLKSFTDAPVLRLAVHAHGFLCSAWLALFLVQTLLIRSGKHAVHRQLGVAGVGLAISMIGIALVVTMQTAPRFPAPGWLFAVTFGDLIMFAAFIVLAVHYRRVSATHKRLMLLATVAVIDAGVARWPIVQAQFGDDPASTVGTFWMYVGTDLPILAAVIYDRIAHARIHAAYVWGGAALVISQALRIAIADAGPWLAMSEALVRLAQ